MEDKGYLTQDEIWMSRDEGRISPTYLKVERPEDWDAHPLQVAVLIERVGKACGVTSKVFFAGVRTYLASSELENPDG